MAEFIENRKILYVDDEESICLSFKSLMRNKKIEVFTLSDSTMIEETLRSSGPFSVVLTDQRMPGKDGVAVLREVMKDSPETMRVMVTGYADMEAVKGAINVGGIIQYISKPWNDNEMRSLVDDLIVRYNVAAERRFLLGELKLKNETLQLLLDGTVAGVVKLLSDAIASVSDSVAAQNVRIRKLGEAILKMMPELDDKEKWDINRALDLFNLGIILLPPLIQLRINKEGIQAVNDHPVAKSHHILAAELLKQIPQFEDVAHILLLMRKQFDGTGEPHQDRIVGKNLPLGSRILKILIDLETLSTDHFRGREVLEEMRRKRNLYDVDLIDRLLGTQAATQNKRRDVRIPSHGLTAGMMLLEDLVTQNGQLLLRKNATLTETMCKLLSQWGNIDPIVSPVYVLLNEE